MSPFGALRAALSSGMPPQARLSHINRQATAAATSDQAAANVGMEARPGQRAVSGALPAVPGVLAAAQPPQPPHTCVTVDANAAVSSGGGGLPQRELQRQQSSTLWRAAQLRALEAEMEAQHTQGGIVDALFTSTFKPQLPVSVEPPPAPRIQV
jgi:hypothetical protein